MSIMQATFEEAFNEEDEFEDVAIESYEYYDGEAGTGVIQTESVFNNKNDTEAPETIKGRVTVLGLGFKVKFIDGSECAADAGSIFKSPFVKAQIKKFNDYYIGKKGYRAATQKDIGKIKLDGAQLFRKIFSINLKRKVDFKMIDGTCLYGLFSWAIKGYTEKLTGRKNSEGGIDQALLQGIIASFTGGMSNIGLGIQGSNNSILSAPYCIVYIKPADQDPSGRERVFVRRLLVIGYWSKKISKMQANYGSGGKDIGTLRN